MKSRDDEFLKAFGQNLKRLRTEKGMSQDDLEHEAGLGNSMIGRIERGERNFQASAIPVISKALKVHPKDLFDF